MKLPPLSKAEALKLECARIGGNDTLARQLYEFIIEKPVKIKKAQLKRKARA